jgi:hypothetical protein
MQVKIGIFCQLCLKRGDVGVNVFNLLEVKVEKEFREKIILQSENCKDCFCPCRVKASSTEWVRVEGKLHLESGYQRAVFYLEGPPRGMDLLVDSVTIKPVNSPDSQRPAAKKQASNYVLSTFLEIQTCCMSQCWHF